MKEYIITIIGATLLSAMAGIIAPEKWRSYVQVITGLDIKARMEKEFKLSVTAECEIMVNDEGEITGVESVRVYGDKLTDRARSRICEVYGLKPYEVHDE